ncbi:hypothetical protein ACFSTC_51930 [Nonomuraea ferruginea]
MTVIIVVLPTAARTLPMPLRAQAGSFMIESLPLQIAGGRRRGPAARRRGGAAGRVRGRRADSGGPW